MVSTSETSLLQLQNLFSDLFKYSERTILVRAETDPLYLPVDDQRPFAEIHFAHGFFSSALHEIAHWLIAGKERRCQEDYGYWYRPDGRTREQQEEFESFESHNQGLEWILTVAASQPFHISSDNLNGDWQGGLGFAEKVRRSALVRLARGFHGRTKIMTDALISEFGDRQSFIDHWDAVSNKHLLPAY